MHSKSLSYLLFERYMSGYSSMVSEIIAELDRVKEDESALKILDY